MTSQSFVSRQIPQEVQLDTANAVASKKGEHLILLLLLIIMVRVKSNLLMRQWQMPLLDTSRLKRVQLYKK
jgi:hypothetical protein